MGPFIDIFISYCLLTFSMHLHCDQAESGTVEGKLRAWLLKYIAFEIHGDFFLIQVLHGRRILYNVLIEALYII